MILAGDPVPAGPTLVTPVMVSVFDLGRSFGEAEVLEKSLEINILDCVGTIHAKKHLKMTNGNSYYYRDNHAQLTAGVI